MALTLYLLYYLFFQLTDNEIKESDSCNRQ